MVLSILLSRGRSNQTLISLDGGISVETLTETIRSIHCPEESQGTYSRVWELR